MIHYLGEKIATMFVSLFVMLYTFIKNIMGLCSTLEVVLLALFLGCIVLSLALLIIVAYFLLTGRLKALMFGIEDGD